MTDAKELLSEEMIRQIETCAREQGRKPAVVLEEAVGPYMALRRLERLAERGGELAKGIREEDVPDVVHKLRQENKARGR